ncbi:MAG: membrane protein insertase YidC [Clostridium sp.]|nr:membrane protein insertase YidC [Clostridium sp.]
MQIIGDVFGWIMYGCYNITHNHSYGLTIILFTLLTKIILLPVSVMVQKNSIKMVKMYPQMNHIKAKYFGNKDMISEEQYALYKKEKYHPMLDLLPVILQLIVLMGVIDVIYKPLRHLLHIGQEYIDAAVMTFSSLTGISAEVGSVQIQLVDYFTNTEDISAFAAVLPNNILNQIDSLDLTFCGFDLGVVPSAMGWNISILVPILAALSAWLMCYTQNKANVLQSEQSKTNQMVTLLLSVGLSLYLGFFVPAGVGFYWILSNLMSIAIMYILNFCINPKKYIDYEALEESKEELANVQQYMTKADGKADKEFAALEKQDYKRFLKYENKQLVFYSEKNGFYKYFQDIIEIILKKTDIVIHYITSDPHDAALTLQSENFQVYYIGENKLIVLMMKMDADMVVMTTPDLQKYHIKRSMVRDDVEYVYIDHGINSTNLMFRKHALDYFDTVFVSNDISYQEIKKQEEVYGLKPKTLVRYGYALIDNMIASYESQPVRNNEPKVILIAPSWQENNILDLCIDDILQNVLGGGYHVILRPHPQYIRHFEGKLTALKEKYAKYPDFEMQMDFSSNETVFNADILITDWSGIAYEYSFTTLKPTLFINTPMKMLNPDYEEIGVTPFDIVIRNQMGISLETDQLANMNEVVQKLLYDNSYNKEELRRMREKYLYNISSSAKVGADYMINRLIEISRNA